MPALTTTNSSGMADGSNVASAMRSWAIGAAYMTTPQAAPSVPIAKARLDAERPGARPTLPNRTPLNESAMAM